MFPEESKDQTDWIGKYGRVALTGEPLHFEGYRQSLKKWVHTSAYSPKKGYFVAIFEDITERKKAEEALRESRAKLQVAFASMTEAIFIADAEGNIVDFNDEFVRYHRFKDKDECSRNIADCPKYLDVWFADGTPAPVEQWAMARALRGEIGSNVEYRLRRKETGETWWGSYNFSPIKDQCGKIVGAVVAGREITEQKKAEEALKENERFYRSIFDNTNDGFQLVELIYDNSGHVSDFKFLRVNAAYERHTGIKADFVVGKTAKSLAPNLEQYWLDAYEKVDKTGQALHITNFIKDTNRWEDVYSYSFGKGLVGSLFRDISHEKQLEQQLRENERMAAIGATAGMVGHDIRNPLQAIT